MEAISQAVRAAGKKLFDIDIEPELNRPAEQFGDYATNVAMRLAKKVNKPPREVAESLKKELGGVADIGGIEVAGPGFINIRLSDQALLDILRPALSEPDKFGSNHSLTGQTVVVEYSDPNPFKVLHAGHLYTSVVGDAIANLYEAAGAKVHRVNFGGDVGLHVAKTMWAILKELDGEHPERLSEIPEEKHADWLTARYIEGNNAYEDDPAAKHAINDLNQRVYQFHAKDDKDAPIAQIYWITRQWSYDYFEVFYKRIGSRFEKFYPESQVAGLGLETVKKHIGRVFVESEGAIVFKGEDYGLHTRVFITQDGLPTYEAKDIGLIMQKYQDFRFDKSVVITGNEQQQYMSVVLKAVEQFAPELAKASAHLTHGMVRLGQGEKMSSRKGNILRAEDVLNAADEANKAATGKQDPQVALGAVKYAFLKQRTGGDIIYDPAESVSLTGHSGPYLQYALVRAKSIRRKAPGDLKPSIKEGSKLDTAERSLARKISEYPEAVKKATDELMPHHVAIYLYELAQDFNRFYEQARIIGDDREQLRMGLLVAYQTVLNNGLRLLNIPIVEQM